MHKPVPLKRKARLRVPPALRAVLWGLLGLVLLPYALTPLYAVVEPVSTLMIWRRIVGEPVHRTYVPIARLSDNLKLAVLVAEDGRFCQHFGVDFAEIRDAIQDANGLSDMRGGSTITQQVAKNLFLWPQRSYVRKALEIPLALWVDLILSKRRILEIYLNIAEWGPSGQFGAEAGTEYALHRAARSLTAAQAALMAASLPNPHDRLPGRPDGELRRLAALYVARSAHAPQTAACVR
jgi:monofunctional biosynthetic peptidoglycan transglycosylase